MALAQKCLLFCDFLRVFRYCVFRRRPAQGLTKPEVESTERCLGAWSASWSCCSEWQPAFAISAIPSVSNMGSRRCSIQGQRAHDRSEPPHR
jgi:hypothetical protein